MSLWALANMTPCTRSLAALLLVPHWSACLGESSLEGDMILRP